MTNTTNAKPAATETGPVCGHCSTWTQGKRIQIRHADSKQVFLCSRPVVELPAPVGMQVAIAAEVTEVKVIDHQPKAYDRFSAKCYVKGCKTHAVKDHPFKLHCSNHGKVVKVKAKQLIGTVSDAEHHHCDSRCEFALGPNCTCSCGGANHSIGFLIKL
jgi:hypothetical protein